jgi:hypothetical protein
MNMTTLTQSGAVRVASTRMPTRWGVFQALGFERETVSGTRTVESALALVMGDLTDGAPLVRVHSQCFTGEVLGSLRCDCNDQLDIAIPDDFARPGHVFPLRARPGGVLERRGQTEAAVDLAGLAGLNPAGVICEILNDDGTMARVPDLIQFCEMHGLVMVTVADLARYRLDSEYERSLWAADASSVCA